MGSRFKITQVSFFRLAFLLFILEVVLGATLLLPITETVRGILSIPLVYLIPGCLLLLALKRKSVDLARFLLTGFVFSVLLSVGASLIIGVVLRALNRTIFMLFLVAASFIFLALVCRRRELTRQNLILIDKYGSLAIALAAIFFSALMLLYAYKSPAPASSDSARYFHAAQNYIRSFSFSPYPPFPLNMWEVAAAALGGAIDFRNLWVVMIANPLLVTEGVSVTLVRTLNIFLSSMLVVATFNLGSLLSERKLGFLAALFVALTPIIIFYSPYELPYICTALFTMMAYSLYLSAVGGEKKNFKLAYLSLIALLAIALLFHITVFFFAFLLIVHFMSIVLKHGGRYVKAISLILFIAFGIIGIRYFLIYSGSRFEQFLNMDVGKSIQTIYQVFLIPIYLTASIWILFITGTLLTFVNKTRKSYWGSNLLMTLCAIPLFLLIFVIFRYGVSFRFFLPLLPLISILAAYGFLESVGGRGLRAFFLVSVSYVVLIFYLANTYPFTVIFPFGRVYLSEVYLTLLPALVVLAWKAAWNEAYAERTLKVIRTRFSVKNLLTLAFVFLISASMISEAFVYFTNPWLGVYVNPVENGLQEAGEWISNNVEAGSVLATNAWTHLGLYVDYTKTPIVPFPFSPSSLLSWISLGRMDYLVILTNLEAPEGITWLRSMYQYLQNYADPAQAPPGGTTEYYRGKNFVVFKVQRTQESSVGVLSYSSGSPEAWTLENGYIQLNITGSALVLSYRQFIDYTRVSQLDLENTRLKIGVSDSGLGSWNMLQWYNYSRNDWEGLNETSSPPSSIEYTQQVRVRLLWIKEDYNMSMQITVERGKPYCQAQWNLFSSSSDTATVFPSIKILEKLNRAYIPSNQTSDWSTNSLSAGNPAGSESVFGLGFLLSHTSGVVLSKDSYAGQQIPSGVLLPEKTKIGGTPVFTFTFDVTNENPTDQWVVVEAYVPDQLIDQDEDGFYYAALQSYNVNDGRWWDFARWDNIDQGLGAESSSVWADTRRATLLDGTLLSRALGYTAGDLGIVLYGKGTRGATVKKAFRKVGLFEVPGQDAPSNIVNITYSSDYGLMSRLGFAIHMPGKTNELSSQLRLRLYLAYNNATSITYELENSLDTHYGFSSINYPFMWLYNMDEAKPSMGLVFDRKPSSLSLSVDTEYFYKNVNIGYDVPKNAQEEQQLYTNLIFLAPETNEVPSTFENKSSSVAFPTAISSLAGYNFTFHQSDPLSFDFEASKVKNEFGVEPLYVVALNSKWSWVSGGKQPPLNVRRISNDQILDVSQASSISFRILPKAIGPSTIILDQQYSATETGKSLVVRVASGSTVMELYRTLIVYMLRRIVVYCTDAPPTQVYVNSKPYDLWQYDPESNLLKLTLVEIPEAEVRIDFS